MSSFCTVWDWGSFWTLSCCISKSSRSILFNNLKTFFEKNSKICLQSSSEAIPNLEVAVGNLSETADEKWGSKLLEFASVSTSCLRDVLIKERTLGHFFALIQALENESLNFPESCTLCSAGASTLKVNQLCWRSPPPWRPLAVPFAHSRDAAETGEREGGWRC